MPVEIARECCFANGFLSNGVLIRPGQLIRYTGEEIVPFERPVRIFANDMAGCSYCLGTFLGLKVPTWILILKNGEWSELPSISRNMFFTSAFALNQYCGLLPVWFYSEEELSAISSG